MSGSDLSRRQVLRRVGQVGTATAALTTVDTAAAEGPPVKKGLARTIARESVDCLSHRDAFTDWDATGVRTPALFHAKTIDNGETVLTPRSWIFPVESGGDDVGYINVSARQTEQPVLTYGRGTAPQRQLATAKQQTPASSQSITDRFIYHGGVEYLVESTEVGGVHLRSGKPTDPGPVQSVSQLSPTGENKQDGEMDWEGETDSEVDNADSVPNWTSTDAGGASETTIGTGDDSWDVWDGCIPIVGSIVLGYHEGLTPSDDDQREALIDRLHISMNTGSCGPICTEWENIPPGIESYDKGDHSYSATNDGGGLMPTAVNEIDNNRPFMLNMENGPYTDKDSGHSVCAFGYRTESCGWLCTNAYYKVHDTYEDSTADLVTHGCWDNACITKINTT